VRARLKRNADAQPLVDIRAKNTGVLRHLQEVWTAANRDRAHPLFIHGDLNFVRVFHAAHQIKSVAPQTNLNYILPIHWKVMTDQNSTTRAGRQSLDVLVLRKVGTYPISGGGRRHMGVAHCQPADVPGGR
jgi:hypothetical protein